MRGGFSRPAAGRCERPGEIKRGGECIFISEALVDQLIGLVDRRGSLRLVNDFAVPAEQPAQPRLSGIMPVEPHEATAPISPEA